MPALIGKPAAATHDQALRRALRPMIVRVRATLPSVRTVGDARRVGIALRKAWPNRRVLRVVLDVGRTAQRSADSAWRRFDRDRKDGLHMDAREYDGPALLEAWSREAAALITSVRDDVAEGLRRDVLAAVEAGTDPKELAAQWRAKGVPLTRGTLEGRTKVIAQHQMSTLHAQVQRERARSVGVKEFVWRTQGDSKVRDEHVALDGQRFAYANPATGEGLPGTPVNCRCWAESVIPDDLAAEFGIPIEGRSGGQIVLP